MVSNSAYENEITSCLSDLVKNGQSVSWENFINCVQDQIVGSYRKNKIMTDFKGEWKSDFTTVAKNLNMKVKPSKDNWHIVEQRITTLDQSSGNTMRKSESNEDNSTSTLKSGSVGSRQSTTEKNYVLTAEEREKSRQLYDSFDESKMWTLSTGTVVEKQMSLFASTCIYEHPVHSLFLDISDPTWTKKNYFTPEEEIIGNMNKNKTPLPSIHKDLTNLYQVF